MGEKSIRLLLPKIDTMKTAVLIVIFCFDRTDT